MEMESDPLGVSEPEKTFAQELKQADDQDQLLVRWCLEGKPRVTADLAPPNSTLWLAAMLLCDLPMSFPDKESTPERTLLHAAFLFKSNKPRQAVDLVQQLLLVRREDGLSASWRRRARACLGWMLASLGDYTGSVYNLELGLDGLGEEDRACLWFASSKLKAELGDVVGSRRDWQQASRLAAGDGDARRALGEARLCFAEGKFEQALGMWLLQCNVANVSSSNANFKEPIVLWFAAFAISVVVGDLGDVVLAGSRQAKHEAANNYAVCALHSTSGGSKGGVGLKRPPDRRNTNRTPARSSHRRTGASHQELQQCGPDRGG